MKKINLAINLFMLAFAYAYQSTRLINYVRSQDVANYVKKNNIGYNI